MQNNKLEIDRYGRIVGRDKFRGTLDQNVKAKNNKNIYIVLLFLLICIAIIIINVKNNPKKNGNYINKNDFNQALMKVETSSENKNITNVSEPELYAKQKVSGKNKFKAKNYRINNVSAGKKNKNYVNRYMGKKEYTIKPLKPKYIKLKNRNISKKNKKAYSNLDSLYKNLGNN